MAKLLPERLIKAVAIEPPDEENALTKDVVVAGVPSDVKNTNNVVAREPSEVKNTTEDEPAEEKTTSFSISDEFVEKTTKITR